MLTDQEIDEMIAASASGKPSEELIALQIRVNERRRLLSHAATKAARPAAATAWHPDDLALAVAAIHAPLTEAEAAMSGEIPGMAMDELCLNVEASECDLWHLLHDLIAVYRKERAWQRHLSPLAKAAVPDKEKT